MFHLQIAWNLRSIDDFYFPLLSSFFFFFVSSFFWHFFSLIFFPNRTERFKTRVFFYHKILIPLFFFFSKTAYRPENTINHAGFSPFLVYIIFCRFFISFWGSCSIRYVEHFSELTKIGLIFSPQINTRRVSDKYIPERSFGKPLFCLLSNNTRLVRRKSKWNLLTKALSGEKDFQFCWFRRRHF